MLPEYAAPNVHSTAVEMLRGIKGRFLDLGCGSGAISERVSSTYPKKFHIIASDFTKEYFKAKARFVKADLNKLPLPFENNSFDAVMLVEVVEHVNNPESLLSEIHRILRKGGRLIISTPNVENWQSRIHFFFQGRFFSFLASDTSEKKPLGMGHVNPLFDFQLRTLIRQKFTIEEIRYNRMRIPLLKHTIPTSLRIFGEVKIIRMKKL